MEFIQSVAPILLALVMTGVVAGILAGLLGVGGGIVMVPVLYFIFQSFEVAPQHAILLATGTSLAAMIPTSIMSIRSQKKRGNVDSDLLKRWGIFLLIGVLAGAALATHFGGVWLTAMFGSLAMLVSLNMLFRAKAKPFASALPGKAAQSFIAMIIGSVSVMIGIGGGTLSVPILTSCSYPPHRAVGTSSAIGLLIAVPGAITMLATGTTPVDAPFGTIGLVNLLGFACIVPMSVVFAPVGVRLGQKLNPVRLKQVFAVALAFTGARMLFSVL